MKEWKMQTIPIDFKAEAHNTQCICFSHSECPTTNVSNEWRLWRYERKKNWALLILLLFSPTHTAHITIIIYEPPIYSSGRLWYENKNFNSAPYPVCLHAMYNMFSTNLYCVIVCFLCVSAIPRFGWFFFSFSLASLKCGGSSCFHRNCIVHVM